MLMMFVRWKPDAPRRGSQPLPALQPDHEAYSLACPLCSEQLGDHGELRMVAIGPSSDETWERHQENRWYSAQALVFHDLCVRDDISILDYSPNDACGNLDCPRCELSLNVGALQPVRMLRIGRNGEVLGFHAPCLGIQGWDRYAL